MIYMSEEKMDKEKSIVKVKQEDWQNVIENHPELKEKFEEIDKMVENSLKVNLDGMQKMKE